MAVIPIKLDDSYYTDESGLAYFEGQTSSKSDIASFSTEFMVGSSIVCTEDWHIYKIGYSGSTKAWLDAGPYSGGGGGGGGGNPGYSVTTQTLTIAAEQTVNCTDMGGINGAEYVQTNYPAEYPQQISATFDGTTYTLELHFVDMYQMWLYGDETFTDTPFFIQISLEGESNSSWVLTSTSGNHTISASYTNTVVTVSDDFQMARGYWITQSEQQYAEEQSVTTELNSWLGTYSGQFTQLAGPEQGNYPDNIKVTINGTEYTAAYTQNDPALGASGYGDGNYHIVPFFVALSDASSISQGYVDGTIYTGSADTFTVSISGIVDAVETSNDFKKAVASAQNGAWFQIGVQEYLNSSSTTFTTYQSNDEIYAAVARGDNIYFTFDYNGGNDSGSFPAIVWGADSEGWFSIGGTYTRATSSSIVSVYLSIDSYNGANCTFTEVSLS